MRKGAGILVRVVGLGVVTGGLLVAALVVGMRRRSPAVRRALTWFNTTVGNPRQLRTAGRPGVPTGVVRHVGRRTGRPYETPVSPIPVDGGFLVALPYGPEADWVRNVLAAGSATLVFDGATHHVARPQVIPTAEALPRLPVGQQRLLRLFGVGHCLEVRTVDTLR